MKCAAIACAGWLLVSATTLAGEAAVSSPTLGDMGLGGMQRLSDDEGLSIRGKGTFAGVWGGSVANFGNGPAAATSSNYYEAGAQWLGKASAAQGQSLSFAGQVQAHFVGPDLAALSLQSGLGGGLTGSFGN